MTDWHAVAQKAREAKELKERLAPYVAVAQARIFEAWRAAEGAPSAREEAWHRLKAVDFLVQVLQEAADGGPIAEANLAEEQRRAAKKG